MSSAPVTVRAAEPLHDLIRVTRGDRRWLTGALATATLAHGVLAWLVLQRGVAHPTRAAPLATELFDIDVPALPAPPAPIPEPAAATPEPASAAARAPKLKPRAAPVPSSTPPSAAPAQAANVLTAQVDRDAPVDLTGFVTGTAATYAGGTTAANGTSHQAGRARGGELQASGGTSTSSQGSAIDHSQPPGVLGDLDWRCPFPAEADTDRIDTASATIRVAVDGSGHVTRVDVLEDPAHGFGRAARRCAMDKAWRAARDRAGAPVAGSVTVRVRFVR